MNNRFFMTGIGTEIGKTVSSLVFCKKLNLTYYKPIQTGSLFTSDSDFIEKNGVKIIKTRINFPAPESPSLAAKKVSSDIVFDDIFIPESENLLIEGAGGVFVPINNNFLMIDLIKKTKSKAIVVTNCKLGSINQTLLTVFALKNAQIPIFGLVFNGKFYEDVANEIVRFSGEKIIAKIPHISDFLSQKEYDDILIEL